MNAFRTKLKLWHLKLTRKNLAPFLELNAFLDENNLSVDSGILELMKNHVDILHTELAGYFPELHDFQKYYNFLSNPFSISVSELPSKDHLIEEQFIDLVNDGAAKNAFRQMRCSNFWIEMVQSYPDVAKMALKLLIPFATTYECESSFSTLVSIKIRSRNKLDVMHDMRVALSKTQPNVDEILKVKQVQISH